MDMFNVGDRVVCVRPFPGPMEDRKGVEATVEWVSPDGYDLKLSKPYRGCHYSAEQFDLVNINLINE